VTQRFDRISNRPFGVKRFQTIYHHQSVDVGRGLVLLFGIGTKALPSWDSRTRRNNLLGGLAVRRMAGLSDQTNLPHQSSRKGDHSTARWSSSFLLSHLILHGPHAVTTSLSILSCSFFLQVVTCSAACLPFLQTLDFPGAYGATGLLSGGPSGAAWLFSLQATVRMSGEPSIQGRGKGISFPTAFSTASISALLENGFVR
jgi:hypothetical protein